MAVDGKQIIAAGVGAGSKGVIGGMVQGLTKGMGAGITADAITGGLGYLVADRMKGWMSDFGMGVLIASIGSIVQQPIETAFGKIKGNEAVAKGNTNTPTASDVDAYLASQYSIV